MTQKKTIDYKRTLHISSTELYRRKTEFWKMMDLAQCAIVIYQGDRLRYVNPAAEVLSGYSQTELLSMNVWDLIHPKTVTILHRLERQRQHPVFLKQQLELVTKTGNYHLINIVITPVEFEGQLAVMGIAIDDQNFAE